jgi:hypothetical protein
MAVFIFPAGFAKTAVAVFIFPAGFAKTAVGAALRQVTT